MLHELELLVDEDLERPYHILCQFAYFLRDISYKYCTICDVLYSGCKNHQPPMYSHNQFRPTTTMETSTAEEKERTVTKFSYIVHSS